MDLSFYQTIIRASGDGILAINYKGEIITCNRMVEKIFNLKYQNILGSHLKDINPHLWPEYLRILDTGVAQIGIKTQANGNTFLENRLPVIKQKKVIGVVSVFREVFPSENICEELNTHKQVTEKLNAIFESLYDGIYITDKDGKTLMVNTSWTKITGLSATEVIGKNTLDLEREGVISKSVASAVLEGAKTVTLSATLKTGKEILATGSPIFDKHGKINLVVINVRDMTDLNNLQRKFKKSKKQTEKYLLELEKFRSQGQKFDKGLIAIAKPSKDVIELALRASKVDAPILIHGETGVGKEIIAKFIHQRSERGKKGIFLKITCGAIPEKLLESELFGYERGAFSGASKNGKIGLFEVADKGTLFLDEIETMPIELQGKLLNAVQDLEIQRIGGINPIKIDTRIIAASNQNLQKMVQEKTFREDLFFRLNVINIYISPLRERSDDIIPLIHFYLQKYNAKYKRKKIITRTVLDYLLEYQWKGNVRELSNLLENLVIMTQSDEITLEDLPAYMKNYADGRSNLGLNSGWTLEQAVRKFEYQLIKEAIDKYGNARKASKHLKIDPTTVSRKIKKFKNYDA
ncbi:MAG: sigma 54-interacting transcriptional regulator [Deltaproteobacteria bacterium]|nr:sigma 54-interacting transcriptional regulator [Deltaproteobacteria bacterium]